MKETELSAVFARNLRQARRNLGFTQKSLGERIGYSEKSVSKWESGEVIAPSNVLPALSEVLQVSIDSLLKGDSEPKYFLGVDGGGTKCDFLLTDANGKTVAKAVLGSCNPIDIGMEAALKVLKEGFDLVLEGISPSQVSVFVGIAGGISGDNKQKIAAFLQKCHFAKAENGSDAENAVAAALGLRDGIAVIAGTGSIAFVKQGKSLRRFGGHGYLIDKGGNGFSMGSAALRTALLYEEGSIKEGRILYSLVKEKCGRNSVLEAISDFYSGGKREIASYAVLVFEAAKRGDTAALGILKENAACIAQLIESAGKAVSQKAVTVALVGGLTSQSGVLLPLIKKELTQKEKYKIEVFVGSPVKGAVLLAGGNYNA
ncbi:MAG: BadF/BadG/BcrA/BcrD ATPase family protein [Acutalibacteraceae bacterium]|nr:BadF/BadG/BcrA/BcrD ATPase family protein [Acutalibacteraceae bacterium]